MKKIITLFIITALLPILANSQSLSPTVVSSSGGFYSSSNAMLSFTVAEMTMVQTFTSTSTGDILTQGFQQPELNSVGIDEHELAAGDIIAYPNPTSGAFSLQYNANDDAERDIIIYNSIGQIVLQKTYHQISGLNKIDFNLSQFTQGMYMVELNMKSTSGKTTPDFRKINLIY